MPQPIAHSGGPQGGPQPLHEHLRGVALRARGFAEAAAPEQPSLAARAEAAGWLHDLGKYLPEGSVRMP